MTPWSVTSEGSVLIKTIRNSSASIEGHRDSAIVRVGRESARLVTSGLLAIPLVVITLLIEEVAEREAFSWDGPLIGVVRGMDNSFYDAALQWVSTIGGGMGLLLLLIPLMTYLILRGTVAGAAFVAIAVLGARALGIILKGLLGRPRPPGADFNSLFTLIELMCTVGLVVVVCALVFWRNQRRMRSLIPFMAVMVVVVVVSVALMFVPRLTGVDGLSFPSGHAVSSMALAAAIGFLAWPTAHRWLLCGVGTLFVAAVGLSRVYFGLHYPSDIIGGWCLSLLWVAAAWTLLRPILQPMAVSPLQAPQPG